MKIISTKTQREIEQKRDIIFKFVRDCIVEASLKTEDAEQAKRQK